MSRWLKDFLKKQNSITEVANRSPTMSVVSVFENLPTSGGIVNNGNNGSVGVGYSFKNDLPQIVEGGIKPQESIQTGNLQDYTLYLNNLAKRLTVDYDVTAIEEIKQHLEEFVYPKYKRLTDQGRLYINSSQSPACTMVFTIKDEKYLTYLREIFQPLGLGVSTYQ